MLPAVRSIFAPTTAFCLVLSMLVGSAGCRRAPATPVVATPQIRLVWGPESSCDNAEVNAFINQAVEHCVNGSYEEYRLLWRYDHRPTSRRHFERLWGMVEEVEVKLLRPMRFRLPDGSINDREMYVFHAFIKLREEAKQDTRGRLDDRDLVLLIAEEDDQWWLVPAQSEVKEKILGPADALPNEPGSVSAGEG